MNVIVRIFNSSFFSSPLVWWVFRRWVSRDGFVTFIPIWEFVVRSSASSEVFQPNLKRLFEDMSFQYCRDCGVCEFYLQWYSLMRRSAVTVSFEIWGAIKWDEQLYRRETKIFKCQNELGLRSFVRPLSTNIHWWSGIEWNRMAQNYFHFCDEKHFCSLNQSASREIVSLENVNCVISFLLFCDSVILTFCHPVCD
jgi:hypothetical protein